jgi:hypothetical protein
MFLLSFGIAWMYNPILASIDKEKRQTTLPSESVDMDMEKMHPSQPNYGNNLCMPLPARRSAEEIKSCLTYNDFHPEFVLTRMLPNDATDWRSWREILLDVLQSRQPPKCFVTAVSEPNI